MPNKHDNDDVELSALLSMAEPPKSPSQLDDYILNYAREQASGVESNSRMKLFVDRPPNPLSIFNQGLDKRLGNAIEITLGSVPMLWDAEKHGSDNPFLRLFSSIDLVAIFQVVLSLLALLFAYDAIAGEHEAGTLRLMMSHPVRRGQILAAKYIGAMVCLMTPLLISLLLAQLLSWLAVAFH